MAAGGPGFLTTVVRQPTEAILVTTPDEARLFELADRILAVGRLISASKEHVDIYRSADRTTPVWTQLENAVMRFIDRNPGATAGEAANATRLVASNFSRALRGLEQKGYVRREVDSRDARRIHLYPTDRAGRSLQRLRELWSRTLDGIFEDPGEVDQLTAALRRIEESIGSPRRTAPPRNGEH